MKWPSRRRLFRVIAIGLVAAVVLVAALGAGDYELLTHRLHHLDITPTTGAPGTTWVIVGSDARAGDPGGPNHYGGTKKIPGQRADVVLVIHQYDGKTSALSIPRDLVVNLPHHRISRLALAYDISPQDFLSGLCETLHIPATHLVVITMKGFAAVVDSLGGITVNIPEPLRDKNSGLSIATAGPTHLDGLQALALVRARHAEMFNGTTWVPSSVAAGNEHRTYYAGVVFHAVAQLAAAAKHDPIKLQRAAWAATSAVTTDSGTSLLSLRKLGLHGATVTAVKGNSLPHGLGIIPNRTTMSEVHTAGFGNCHMAVTGG